MDILDADAAPPICHELLRQLRVSLPYPEHATLPRKAQRRARSKVAFRIDFPALAEDFFNLAEGRYSANAAYHRDQILKLLSVFDSQDLETALTTALALGGPEARVVKVLLPEALKQPEKVISLWPAGFPAVSKRPMSAYRSGYGGQLP